MTEYYSGIGSRETPTEIQILMTSFARHLSTLGFILRSGGAPGADSAFELGALPGLSEIYLPWQGFNNKKSNMKILPEAIEIAAKYHPAWGRLNSSARQFHTRNVHQILGADLRTPSKFVVCWTSDGKASGGTGQAMRIALDKGIPIYNLYHRGDIIMLEQYLQSL